MSTSSEPLKHHSQKSEGELASRHASVLLAKSSEELEAAYDNWASMYDEDLAQLSGTGYNVAGVAAAKVIARHFSPSEHPALLDFGCGTGTAGPFLKELGWTEGLHGNDLSQGMLEMALKRNCYEKLTKSTFESSNCEAGAYDIVHAAGVFAPGQAPPSAFDEFLRLLKIGGHAVFTVRIGYYDSDEGAAHRKHLEDLVNDRRWEMEAKTEEDYLPKDGVKAYVFVMKKL